MKRIGVTTIFNVPNFGSVLQAYATQKILQSLGYEVEIINYQFPNGWHYSHGLIKHSSLKSKIAIWLGVFPYHRKLKKIDFFRKKYLNLTKLYSSLDDLKRGDWSRFALFCVGSDQVWNPRFVLGDSAYMLSYIPVNTPRFSLASSFAVKTLPESLRAKYAKYLSTFDGLSVREKNGLKILNDELNINKRNHLLLDPTLLLDKGQWTQLADTTFKKKRKYILLYMLCYSFEPRPYIFEVVKYYQQKYGYEVIVLEGYKDAKKSGLKMIDATDSTVSSFIRYFLNASMVVTSSFHGTAFAVNFGCPLISIIPDGSGDDRQSTLLSDLGLSQCIVPINHPLEKINPFYDSEAEQKCLNTLRIDSLSWISKTLESID